MRKLFAVGDIHGCLFNLKKLLAGIEIDYGRDCIYFLGDYIDRGSDSRGVIDFIIDLKRGRNNVFCLSGNHEELFIDYLKHGSNEDTFYLNGGLNTLISYNYPQTLSDIPESHLEFFTSLKLCYEIDDYIFVHAGMRPYVPFNKQVREDMLWIRDEFINSHYDFGKTVVFGHTPFRHPLIEVNKIGIDTGAVYGGKLTCVELPDRKIHQF